MSNNFVLMRSHELPEEWQLQVDPEYTRLTAMRLGIPLENVLSLVVLEAPDTAAGRAYYHWYINAMNSMESNTATDIVPVMLTNLQDFGQLDGRMRLSQFNNSLSHIGRPCHLARVDGAMTTPESPENVGG